MMRMPPQLQTALVVLSLAAGTLVADTRVASAQERGAPPQGPSAPQRNLLVLPASTSQEEILQVMQRFTAALGVDCAYCHVQAPTPAGRGGGGRGRGAAAFDYVSDEKPQKKIARAMMMMVRDLNTSVATAVGRAPGATASVGCITCHRGIAVPLQLADVLDRAVKERGKTEAVTTYRDLRRRYFGAQAFDFSEGSLIAYADRALRAGQPDDAITWLELNLTYFPRSAPTYAALSNAQQQKKDTAGAVASLERAVALNPDNVQLQRQLEQLRASLTGR
jgi:hypothetical protein